MMINNSSHSDSDTDASSIIGIKSLVDSLKKKFEILRPFSATDCCIYRVPQPIRHLNERLYTPQVISIGPFHRGREELLAMEEHKIRYLQDFLLQTEVSLEDLLIFIKEKEDVLRSCYSETIKLESDEFVEMVLVDAVFLVEFFVRDNLDHELNIGGDTRGTIEWFIQQDLWLVENQLPIFIIDELFNLANTKMSTNHYQGLSISYLICTYLKYAIRGYNLWIEDDNLLEINFYKAEHFVDLMILCLTPPETMVRNARNPKLKTLITTPPNVTELHKAGVKFKSGSGCNNLFDIRFENGILEIPHLKLMGETERLLRNLQVFERLHCSTNYINDYISIMGCLVNTSKDVELLIQNGIIENRVANKEQVSTLFQNLAKEGMPFVDGFLYSGVIEDLNSYCESGWYKWKANLKLNYFNTPWIVISVVAAVVFLVLTLIQTVFSIIK